MEPSLQCGWAGQRSGHLKTDSHIGCRAHALPLRRAAKGLECLSLLIYTVRPCLIQSCHAATMLCSDHAVLLKATTQHGRRETACGLLARVRVLPATTRSSTKIVIRIIPVLLTMIHRVNHTVIGHLREVFSFLRSRRQGFCWKVIWNTFLECLFIP